MEESSNCDVSFMIFPIVSYVLDLQDCLSFIIFKMLRMDGRLIGASPGIAKCPECKVTKKSGYTKNHRSKDLHGLHQSILRLNRRRDRRNRQRQKRRSILKIAILY